MKISISGLILLFFLLSTKLCFAQTNYYISDSDGDDAANGLTSNTAWKSIPRLNLAMINAKPGDSYLLKRGDIFSGRIQFDKDGTALFPILLGAYGDSSLSKPKITGMVEVSGWVNTDSNLWEANCNECSDELNQLLINNVSQQIGRYPNLDDINKGYMTISKFEGDSAIIDEEIPTHVNWKGATLVTRTERWVLDRSEITNHINDRIEFYDTRPYRILKTGIGFFLQNHIATLDLEGEWCYNKINNNIAIYTSVHPDSLTIEVSAKDTLLDGSNDHYIIKDLIFHGSNTMSFLYRKSKDIRIRNCEFIDGGQNGLFIRTTDNAHIENNYIANNNNNGLKMVTCDSAIVEYNVIENNGMRRGMGGNAGGQHAGANIVGVGNTLRYNRVSYTGMAGIRASGPGTIIYRNFIQYACSILDDNGGIYTWGENYENREIIENIVLNSIGDIYGTRTTISDAKGIYIDRHSSFVTVKNNTIAFCDGPGLNLNTANHITAKENNIFGCQKNLRMSEHISELDFPLSDNIVTNNVAVAVERHQFAAYFKTIIEGYDHFGIVDSNYYWKPIRNEAMIGISSNEAVFPEYVRDDDARGFGQWLNSTKHDHRTNINKIIISDYTINNTIGSDLIKNGEFNNGLYYWGSEANISLNIIDSGPLVLDSMSLEINEKTGAPAEDGYLFQIIGGIDTVNAYILKFTLISDVDNEVLEFILKDRASGADISQMVYFELSPDREEKEYLIVPNTPSKDAEIRFYVENEDGTVVIDNVEFYEVDANINDPYSNFFFDYNYSDEVKTVVLDEPYMDVYGNVYQRNIDIQPYRSVILYKASLEEAVNAGFDLLPTNQNLDISVYPNPAKNHINIGIDTKGLYETPIVKIYSVDGILVKEFLFDNQSIDISDLKSGVFLIVLHKKNMKGILGTEKLIVE